MPPRSNEFQRLILAIEKQLAPAGARAVESLMLPDIDGTQREIDVAVDTQIGIHPLRVAIECRDHARAADVSWIEQLHGKYRDLPVNQVVAVSRSGFSPAAAAKALRYGIRALTLEEAEQRDWVFDICGVASVHFQGKQYDTTSVELRFRGDIPPTGTLGNTSEAITLSSPTGERRSLEALLASHISSGELQKKVDEAIDGTSGDSTETLIDLSEWVVVDGKGKHWPLSSAQVTVRRSTETAEVQLTPAKYGEAAVAYGSVDIGAFRWNVVVAGSAGAATNPPISLTVDLAKKK